MRLLDLILPNCLHKQLEVVLKYSGVAGCTSLTLQMLAELGLKFRVLLDKPI